MTSSNHNMETYSRCLDLATACGQAEFRFWQAVIDGLDTGRLQMEDLPRLIFRSSWEREGNPSRATTYRLVERWRERLADMANPGRGA